MKLDVKRGLAGILCQLTLAIAVAGTGLGQKPDKCAELPDYNKLKTTLISVVKQGKEANSGLGNPEWAAVVNRDGIVSPWCPPGPTARRNGREAA